MLKAVTNTSSDSNRSLIVEKIGGTSMSRFDIVLKNVIYSSFGLANRIIVVSAYGGVTNLLLEHKKNGQPGVYSKFVSGLDYSAGLDHLQNELCKINLQFLPLKLDIELANKFVISRCEEALNFLTQIKRVLAYGYVEPQHLMLAARELLAGIGESHSAFNTVNILNANRIKSVLVDLSGWGDTNQYTIDERINNGLKELDLSDSIAIATGYCRGTEGIMRHFDRGYSEVTFSKIAVLFKAKEAVIHKEYHLSSGDPNLIGEDKVVPIGNTNFDVADQLADIGMEAIHPRAAKPIEQAGIEIWVKNIFDPEHKGTRVSRDFRSLTPKVEIISGSDKLLVLEVHDTLMVSTPGFDYQLMKLISRKNISYIFKSTNANTITLLLYQQDWSSDLTDTLSLQFQKVTVSEGALVSVIGSNLDDPEILANSGKALLEANIKTLGVSQASRSTSLQFVVKRSDFNKALVVLHKNLIERRNSKN